jgi:hypothetical protein
MTAICTYFDRNYLPQGLALYRSLVRTQPCAELWALCLDEETRSIVDSLKLPRMRIISLEDLFEFERRLQEAKSGRSVLEFYYACTPQLVRYVAATAARGSTVAYVDADVYFFRDPSALYTEEPDADILLIEHRSGDPSAEAERGRFNLCFVRFKPTENAAHALDWWCEMTLQSTAMDAETWGDQKYLDRFPDLFESVGILRSPETSLAPWNVWQHDVSGDDGEVKVDGRSLVAYHFARYLVVGPHLFSPIRREWLPRKVLRSIYRPYAREIRESFVQIRSVAPAYSVGHTRRNRRGLILGLFAGRLFYEGRLGLWRLGVYLPNTRKECRAQTYAARRRLSGRTKASHG